jgi:hypothetical protein
MSTASYQKLKPSKIEVDSRWQRELDEGRAKRMAKQLNKAMLGVPVVSKRPNGELIALDGQHRIMACRYANMDDPILCDVQEGLSLADEADLFLMLNSNRKAVRVYDKFKARLVAKDSVAMEIKSLVASAGLRVSKAPGTNCVCAIKALEMVHTRYGNLRETLDVLTRWADGDPCAFDGNLLKDVSHFLAAEHDKPVSIPHLCERLQNYAPKRILAKIKRQQGVQDECPRAEAAIKVFRDIYNQRTRDKLKTKAA